MSVDKEQKENSVHNSSVSPRDFIVSVAFKISSQPLSNFDPDVWDMLTAISTNARKRHQGINMLLTEEEHYIGRLVDDIRFQVESTAVSATHCKIFKRTHGEDHPSAFLKDTRDLQDRCLVRICQIQEKGFSQLWPSQILSPTDVEVLDSFTNTEFWYLDQGIVAPEVDGSASFCETITRQDGKWWLPVPRVLGCHRTN